MHRILIQGILLGVMLSGACTPAPRYHSREPEPAPPAAPRGEGDKAALSIRLAPPVKDFDMRRVTSPFAGRGARSGASRRHDGIDIKAARGEEIFSAAAGVITLAGRQSGYGNIVIVDHGDCVSTAYAHLFYACVRKGQRVGTGERIGRAGKRGRATGVHLHFELRREGVAIDPAPYLWLDSGGQKQP